MIAKFKKNNRGFTLLETLIAVLILAMAITGPLSIASRSLNNSLIAKDQITAFFLAQDAIEYVRFARDSNTLLSADWINGTGGTSAGTDISVCASGTGCYVDSTLNNPTAPTACDVSAGCPIMYYDTTNSRYTYDSSGTTRTAFTRQILFTQISPTPPATPSTEYKLSVTVSWKDVGGVTRQVSVYENIFKWQ